MSVGSIIATVVALTVCILGVAWEPIAEWGGFGSTGSSSGSGEDAAIDALLRSKPKSHAEHATAGTCPFGYTGADAAADVVRYVASPSDANVQFAVIDVSSFAASSNAAAEGGARALPPGHEQVTAARQARVAEAMAEALTTTGFFL